MELLTELRLGYIPYLNCIPCFHYLKESGFNGELVSGVPAELNLLLQQGQLDVSPSSSFEYARNWKKYLLLPDHSISSFGRVKSVLFFSPVELSELSGEEIAITGESATSINLLRIILREFYNLENVTDIVPDYPIEVLVEQRKPALLIGDRALRLVSHLPRGMKVFDLGEIWYQQTGLPFVFALWMIHRQAVDQFPLSLSALGQQLTRSRMQFMSEPYPIARSLAEIVGLGVESIVDYWRTIDYRLEKEHLQSLQLFFKLCVKYQLLAEQPELNFLQ